MKYSHLIISLAMLAAVPCTLRAQSSFRSLIEQAVDVNPSVRAADTSIDAALAAARADNALDGPEIEFEHLWASASSDKKWNVGISQEFGLPGLYRARSQAAALMADAARIELFGMKADKALSAKLLILDIINACTRRQVYEGIADNIARIASLTERQYDSGNATVLSLRKMRLALVDTRRAISDIDADITTLRHTLEGMGVQVPGDGDMWLHYPIQALESPEDDDNAYINALAEARGAAQAAASRAVRLEAWPKLAVGYRHAFEENQHFNGLSVSLRLPSFSQKKRREAARLEAESSALLTAAEATELRSESRGLYESAVAMASTLSQYRDLMGDDSYLSLLGKAYDGGELSVIEYLQEVNLYTDSRLNYLDLLYRYNLALARLNRYRSLDF